MATRSHRKSILCGRPRPWPAAVLALVVCGPAGAQSAGDLLDGEIEGRIESRVTDAVEARIEAQVEATASGGIEAELEEDLTGTLGLDESDAGRSRTFLAATDDDGWTVERDTWVMLIDPAETDRIERWGFTVRERRPLAGLDLVLVRLDAPADRNLDEVAAGIALDAPGTVIDYNHVYRPDEAAQGAADCAHDTGDRPLFAPGRRAAVGIVDTAVATGHPALAPADIVHRDFVPFAGARPLDHGTAVASILVGDSERLTGRLPGARLHAASVFFRDGEGGIGATTGSLVEALAWLGEAGVPVINMSLSGPPNRLLEKVIDRMAAEGAIVVAAVGNNGPAGKPLYPAAYEPVVGITAVDDCHRVFRYANRGRQVTFSAPGVSVKVALGDGGYGLEEGTSMAAPHAAAVIAGTLAGSRDAAGVVEALKTAALDLGERGFDDVYGFGLIGPPH